jgi:hypothetical protein
LKAPNQMNNNAPIRRRTSTVAPILIQHLKS